MKISPVEPDANLGEVVPAGAERPRPSDLLAPRQERKNDYRVRSMHGKLQTKNALLPRTLDSSLLNQCQSAVTRPAEQPTELDADKDQD